jgi:hypothetical protein
MTNYLITFMAARSGRSGLSLSQQRFDIPRQQRLKRRHGIRGRQIFEDVIQVRIRLKAVGACAAPEGE